MYADRITPSMRAAIRETLARRRQQATYNRRHNITPRSISKPLRPSLITTAVTAARQAISAPPREEFSRIIKELESKMRLAAANLEFEQAAQLRDLIAELRQRKRKQEFQKADTRSR
jgi:excinuclease ABC subunit B